MTEYLWWSLSNKSCSVWQSFLPRVDQVIKKKNTMWEMTITTVVFNFASAPLIFVFEIQAPKNISFAKPLSVSRSRQLRCSFITGLIICAEFETIRVQNVHLRGFCQATGHDASPCPASHTVSVCHIRFATVHLLVCVCVPVSLLDKPRGECECAYCMCKLMCASIGH